MKKLVTFLLIIGLTLAGSVGASAAPPDDDLRVLHDVLDLINERFLGQVDQDSLIAGALNGLMQSLDDPYSEYFTPEEYADFLAEVTSERAGLGVVVQLTEGNLWQVQSVLPGSPAERAGVVAGDILLRAGNVSLTGLSLEQLQQALGGEAGTEVRVEIVHNGSSRTLLIERAVIHQPTVAWSMLTGGIGHVYLSSFGENTAQELQDALQQMNAQGMRALIVDLRDNPGGLMQSVVDVAALLVPAGAILRLVDRDGYEEEVTVAGPGLGLPMAVLVNEWSASAAEVLAGAIADRTDSKLIGERTYGKGVMQDIYELGDDGRYGAMKITTAEFFTPDGTQIQAVGLEPDLVISPNTGDIPLLTESGTLYPGLQGEAVQRLQEALAELSFYRGEINGKYDQATLAAVKQAQLRDEDPVSDGICDGWTQMLINDMLVEQAVAAANQQMVNAARSWLMGRIMTERLGVNRWLGRSLIGA